MRHEGAFWIGGFLAGFLVGLALSLTYTWVLDPPPLNDTTPAALTAQDKEVYTVLIAAAFVANGDLDATRNRLAELEDPDIRDSIVALAERYINTGRDARDIRALARLADALGGTSAAMRPFIATPTPRPSPSATPTSQPPTPTFTPQVRETPTPTPGRRPAAETEGGFEVVQSTALCDPASDGLLRVYVRDTEGNGLPGVQILVDWPGGQDRFYTGFKPEAGPGYADFEMKPDEVYQVRLVDFEASLVQEVGMDLADRCPGLPDSLRPSWQVVFQESE